MLNSFITASAQQQLLVISGAVILTAGIAAAVLKFSGKRKGDMASKEDDSILGFLYNKEKNIFYSGMYAWQRDYGYCKLYDETAPPLGLYYDCDPFVFPYEGKNWLIEIWKGQYGMTTGAEVGVYYTDKPMPADRDEYLLLLFDSVDDSDMPDISFTLFKDSEPMFQTNGRHWWLTGFRLGEYAKPEELIMIIDITLKDENMRDSFIASMVDRGYPDNHIIANGSSVRFMYGTPKSPQPAARSLPFVRLQQRCLKKLCKYFRKLTAGITDAMEQLEFMRSKHRIIYRLFLKTPIRDHRLKGYKKFEKAVRKQARR